MSAAFYIMAILGCGEADAHYRFQRIAQLGLVYVQQTHEREDDPYSGMGVPCPEEVLSHRVAHVAGVAPADHSQEGRTADLDRRDGDQQDCRDEK